METIDKMTNGFFNAAGFKLALIAVLSLFLLIPGFMIMELIREREQRRDETIREVTAIWGNEQTICGPVLTIPFKAVEKTEKDEYRTVTRLAHYLPDSLIIKGELLPEMRYRGIYKVITYRARLHFSGTFAAIDPSLLGIKEEDFRWDQAWIESGISDMRGINQEIIVHWGDSAIHVMPGIPVKDLSGSGIHSKILADPDTDLSFSFDLDINGSRSLNFIPLGKETRVSLSSVWNAPSFQGAFLPDERKVNQSGFSADWKILQLNRNYPQQWIGDQYTTDESAFGVDLITPVDTYQKSMRSVKYALLFIGLTFLVFFFAEVLTRKRIHPVNYLLTGVALCIFYSLLIALAEQVSFALAYLISSLTIISMIAAFAHSLYRNRKVTTALVGTLLALYVFLYVILQMMDYSLLFGNIGLVIILALVMYFSRKVDWYSGIKNSHT